MALMELVRAVFSDDAWLKFRRYQGLHFRSLQNAVFRVAVGSNLKVLARIYGSDKWGSHWYAQHYERHFRPLRGRTTTLLEIGIGGYGNPIHGGGSLRMWRTYFPSATIYGIDIADKSPHDERRIKTFRGSQVDTAFLDRVLEEIGEPDIIIDDGSHMNAHVIATFTHLFPRLAPNGIYVVEDTQTAYVEEYGGHPDPGIGRLDTSIGFLKSLTDGLNYPDFVTGREPTYLEKHITGIYFYHNIVFVQKGLNNEKATLRR